MSIFYVSIRQNQTKILVIAPKLSSSIIMKGTIVNNNCIRFVNTAKNLGVILDDSLSFEQQISRVVKSCICTIRKIAKIKSFLSYEQLRTLVSTCVFSKLDCCNALYFGVDLTLIRKLQKHILRNYIGSRWKKKGYFSSYCYLFINVYMGRLPSLSQP